MTELTAAQVLALSALAEGRPMTTAELARAVADMGMHLGEDYAAATVQSLTEQGMAEQIEYRDGGRKAAKRFEADVRAGFRRRWPSW